jgi:ATP-dependent DNA ligase
MQKVAAPLRFNRTDGVQGGAWLPEGAAWQYEVKLDGYRTLAIKQHGECASYSRNGRSFDALFPRVVER